MLLDTIPSTRHLNNCTKALTPLPESAGCEDSIGGSKAPSNRMSERDSASPGSETCRRRAQCISCFPLALASRGATQVHCAIPKRCDRRRGQPIMRRSRTVRMRHGRDGSFPGSVCGDALFDAGTWRRLRRRIGTQHDVAPAARPPAGAWILPCGVKSARCLLLGIECVVLDGSAFVQYIVSLPRGNIRVTSLGSRALVVDGRMDFPPQAARGVKSRPNMRVLHHCIVALLLMSVALGVPLGAMAAQTQRVLILHRSGRNPHRTRRPWPHFVPSSLAVRANPSRCIGITTYRSEFVAYSKPRSTRCFW